MSCSVTLGVLKANLRHWTLSSGITCSSTSFRGSPLAVECFAVEGTASSRTEPLRVMSWKTDMCSDDGSRCGRGVNTSNALRPRLRRCWGAGNEFWRRSRWGRKNEGSDGRTLYTKRSQGFQDPGKSKGTHYQAFQGHLLKNQIRHFLKELGKIRAFIWL